ncbi:hypothetical protein CKM354_000715200 [Cercospora kikuchii]|uniref:Oxidase ustYa n=1 Tax=Cercospora kikuchii TaxID=84275 RepID=A0A9P3CJL9_9PEZI|nr:uncharacterized protein CKM354_000715200 [Cercospora kikuchii]GIZ43943.1 hypothetical protein CKM354_000715200 [Cercospora kikuchii]
MKSIFNTEAKLGKEYRRLSLDDEEGNRSASPRVIFTKQGNRTLYACILLLALGWLATCAYVYRTRFQSNGLLHVYYNTPIPKDVFKPVKKVFHRDERYVGWNDEVNRNWDRLVAGHDAVWIENPERWGLPPGQVAPYEHPNTPDPKPHDFYVISTLHSLHCLNMIRFQFFSDKYGHVEDGDFKDPDYTMKHWDVHIEHCFEYMRQSISCGGDLILEGSSAVDIDGKQVTSVTGWGVEHDCIDFDLLWQFQTDQEAKYNRTWQLPS